MVAPLGFSDAFLRKDAIKATKLCHYFNIYLSLNQELCCYLSNTRLTAALFIELAGFSPYLLISSLNSSSVTEDIVLLIVFFATKFTSSH